MSLKSFSVRNFRCLTDFELHNIARINLLVGDNDTGKTALLEALFAHLSQANAINLVTLKGFRQRADTLSEGFWREFFSGFDEKNEIQLLSVDSTGKQRLSKLMVGATAQVSLSVPSATGDQIGDKAFSFRPLRVEYTDSGLDKPVVNEVTAEGRRLLQRQQFSPDLNAYFFSTAGLPDPEGVAKHVSQLFINKQEASLLHLAKVIDERIDKLSVASPKGISEVFLDLGQSRLFPLTLMGSGVFRALGIAAAIPAYSGGIVLVDEVDSGIYYKRLGDLWRGIYQLARDYDVQLFATSHSAECVSAAIDAVTPDLADPDPLHVYRLERGRRTPIPYESKSLRSAVEFMADVR